MSTLTLRAAGDAPVALAWERYADPSSWRQWSPQIRRVETDGVRIRAGLTGRVLGPPPLAVHFVVEDVDEDRMQWAWRVRLGPVRLRLEHGVRTHGAGSRTWLRLEGPAPVIWGYAPVARYALTRLVRP